VQESRKTLAAFARRLNAAGERGKMERALKQRAIAAQNLIVHLKRVLQRRFLALQMNAGCSLAAVCRGSFERAKMMKRMAASFLGRYLIRAVQRSVLVLRIKSAVLIRETCKRKRVFDSRRQELEERKKREEEWESRVAAADVVAEGAWGIVRDGKKRRERLQKGNDQDT
jgi:hypothetical protein